MGSGEAGGEVAGREDVIDDATAGSGAYRPAGDPHQPEAPVDAPASAPEVKQEHPSATWDAPSLGANEWSHDGRSTGDDSGAHGGGYGPPQAQGSGGDGGSGDPQGTNSGGAGRKRTPRQQEQNKHVSFKRAQRSKLPIAAPHPAAAPPSPRAGPTALPRAPQGPV